MADVDRRESDNRDGFSESSGGLSDSSGGLSDSSGGLSDSSGDIEVRGIAAERLTFFADAVIAIALTLLALDLTPPSGTTAAELWRSAVSHSDEYKAFLISFLVIAAHWRSHHKVFRYVTHLDGRLTTFTLCWLLAQVVTPFATRIITGDGAYAFRFGFYALVQVLADVMFLLMTREIQVRRMYREDTPPGMFTGTYLRTFGIGGGFLVSIPLSFVSQYSYLLWIVVPVAVLRVPHLRRWYGRR